MSADEAVTTIAFEKIRAKHRDLVLVQGQGLRGRDLWETQTRLGVWRCTAK